VKRRLVYKPAAQRELSRVDRSDAERIIHSPEVLAAAGHGDVKALKDALKGRYRLRVGKWRVFFSFDQPGMRHRQPRPGLPTFTGSRA
jgi:mRNA-degrading endonuclease RelE of RelBE toxin-antitoxin system